MLNSYVWLVAIMLESADKDLFSVTASSSWQCCWPLMAWALNSKASRLPYKNLDVGRASRKWFGRPCAQSVLNPYFQFHWFEKLQVWLILAMISTMNWMFASLQNSSYEVLFSLSHFCSVVSDSLQLHGLCPLDFRLKIWGQEILKKKGEEAIKTHKVCIRNPEDSLVMGGLLAQLNVLPIGLTVIKKVVCLYFRFLETQEGCLTTSIHIRIHISISISITISARSPAIHLQ